MLEFAGSCTKVVMVSLLDVLLGEKYEMNKLRIDGRGRAFFP